MSSTPSHLVKVLGFDYEEFSGKTREKVPRRRSHHLIDKEAGRNEEESGVTGDQGRKDSLDTKRTERRKSTGEVEER